MKNKKEKKKKSRAGKVILFLLFLVILLAALLFFGKGFGFGFGLGEGLGLGTNDGEAAEVMATVSGTQTDVPEEEPSGPIAIEINETTIIFGAQSFDSYEAFEEYFYKNADKESEYILKDNMAIKSVYDSVKSLLDSFGANYSEENT